MTPEEERAWFASLGPDERGALKHARTALVVDAAREVSEAIGYRDWKRVAARGKVLDDALRRLDLTKEKVR